MRTSDRIRPSFSEGKLNFTLPKSWTELSQLQLMQVFAWMGHLKIDELKTRAFFRWAGIEVVDKGAEGYVCLTKSDKGPVEFTLELWQVAEFIRQLDWLSETPLAPVRLERIDGYKAVDVKLIGVPFGQWLQLDNYYQGYIGSRDPAATLPLRRAACLLYLDKDGDNPKSMRLTEAELLSVFYWILAVKNLFMRQFPHFFRPVEGGVEQSTQMEVMNAQIRALTGGDVTKEQQVLDLDVWRALTELDAKAREAQELQRQLSKQKNSKH